MGDDHDLCRRDLLPLDKTVAVALIRGAQIVYILNFLKDEELSVNVLSTVAIALSIINFRYQVQIIIKCKRYDIQEDSWLEYDLHFLFDSSDVTKTCFISAFLEFQNDHGREIFQVRLYSFLVWPLKIVGYFLEDRFYSYA